MLSYSELNASNWAYFYYIVFGSYFCHRVFETLIKSASGTLKKLIDVFEYKEIPIYDLHD